MARILVPALALLFALPALPAAAERVGNVGAVNPAAFGAPPGAARRPLSLGLGVSRGERIDTAGEGSAQIVFNDSSTLTVGRNSSATIDEFVYRGGAGAGSQGVSLAKGVMRFVGGGVSHGAGASLKAPAAVIGIRGGSVLVQAGGGDCGTLVVHQFGAVEVTGADGSSQLLNRPGFGVCASASGVSEPFRVPSATIAAIVAQMASRGRQSGGASVVPTNESAAALGDHAPASVEPPPGLAALAPVWAGDAVAQSAANANNQPAPPRPRAAPPPAEQKVETPGEPPAPPPPPVEPPAPPPEPPAPPPTSPSGSNENPTSNSSGSGSASGSGSETGAGSGGAIDLNAAPIGGEGSGSGAASAAGAGSGATSGGNIENESSTIGNQGPGSGSGSWSPSGSPSGSGHSGSGHSGSGRPAEGHGSGGWSGSGSGRPSGYGGEHGHASGEHEGHGSGGWSGSGSGRPSGYGGERGHSSGEHEGYGSGGLSQNGSSSGSGRSSGRGGESARASGAREGSGYRSGGLSGRSANSGAERDD